MAEYNKSYFYGDDTPFQTGWGNTSYFTYHSQFNRDSRAIVIVEVVALLVLMITGIVGNLTVTYIVLNYTVMNRISSLSIASTGFAGVLFLLGIPFIATTRLTESWRFGRVLCGLVWYGQLSSGTIIVWTMAYISIDRYRNLVTPLKKPLSNHWAKFVIFLIWVFNFVCYSPLILAFTTRQFESGSTKVTICTLLFPRLRDVRISSVFVLGVAITGYLIPLALMLFNYYNIYKALRTRYGVTCHKWRGKSTSSSGSSDTQTTQQIARSKRDLYVIKQLNLQLFVFLLMWLPMIFFFVAIQIDTYSCLMQLRSQFLIAAKCVAFSYSVLNPFVCAVYNKACRDHLKDMFRINRNKNKVSSIGPHKMKY